MKFQRDTKMKNLLDYENTSPLQVILSIDIWKNETN